MHLINTQHTPFYSDMVENSENEIYLNIGVAVLGAIQVRVSTD